MNTTIFGKRRQGKSTLAMALAVTWHNRVIVFDPNDQLPIIGSVSVGELASWISSHPENGSYQFVRVGPFDTEDVPDEFAGFSSSLWECRGVSIIVDEAHMLQGGNSLDPNLDRWNRRSTSDVAVIQTTHRIVDAHPDSRYHADHVFFFYAYLSRELKTIRENFGDDTARLVPGLRPHQVVHWTKAAGGIPVVEVWPDGREWFIDLENENQ